MNKPVNGSYGISIVICCHNSAERLPDTLKHLSEQVVDPDVAWEIILVNNASSDATSDIARDCWGEGHVAPLVVIDEPRVGLMYARMTGMRAASYDTIGFIDDDNWVAPGWINIAARIIADNPDIGICGGFNEPETENFPPAWFGQYARSYATGSQEEREGDATNKKGVVFGAGMVVNKKAFVGLLKDGFEPILVGRQGDKLTCGEDYEMCLAMRLAGWKIWYEPKLKIRHYIPSNRLEWAYLKKVYRIVGTSSLGLDPYYMAYAGSVSRDSRIAHWQYHVLKSIIRIMKRAHVYIVSRMLELEGKRSVLMLEREIGRLLALMASRGQYDKNIKKVNEARWATVRLIES